jgi:hypothetical protein
MKKISTVKLNMSGFRKFADELKGWQARVGVLKTSPARESDEGEISNYDIAIISEFGSETRNIPARSWANMPITTHKDDIMKFSGKQAALLTEGRVELFFKKLGAEGVRIVQEAFATRGFGRWAPNTQSTIDAKGGKDSPLIDTGDFRESITFDTVRNGKRLRS